MKPHRLIALTAWSALIVALALVRGEPELLAQHHLAQSQATGQSAPKLAPLEISPLRRQLIGLRFATVTRRELSRRIETTGLIEVNERLLGYVQVRTPGWVRRVYVDETWQFVRKGAPLVSIYSPEITSAEREYLLALEHHKRLSQSTIEGVASGAQALVDAAEARLRLFGVPEREIARLRGGGAPRTEVDILAPMSGVVLAREAQTDLYATPDARLYTLADLSEVWIYAAVFQNQLDEIRVNDPVEITVDSYSGRIFTGRVDFIAAVLDGATRTARVRINLPNRDGTLKIGMFARAALKPSLGTGLVIPASCVLQTGLHDVAFVDRGDGYLTPVEVELGPRVEGGYVVRSGLREGERVVASANFLIDSESRLQAALGGFVPPPPGAGGPAAAGPTATVTLRTEPDPPAKGRNKVLITVRDSFGRPVDDATVSVVFFMAAMPAMGMAEMRASAVAEARGSGGYEAEVTLPSGGTWQVTVAASKGGQLVARQTTNLTAAGPM